MGHVLMDLNWHKPLMTTDGRAAIQHGPRCSDLNVDLWNIDVWDPDMEGWRMAVFSNSGIHDPHVFGDRIEPLMNRPVVDFDGCLYWMDTEERAFIRERHYDENTDDPQGHLYHVTIDGMQHGLPARVLGNLTIEQTQAQARLAIKKAQQERAKRRELEQLDQLADAFPSVFGSF